MNIPNKAPTMYNAIFSRVVIPVGFINENNVTAPKNNMVTHPCLGILYVDATFPAIKNKTANKLSERVSRNKVSA